MIIKIDGVDYEMNVSKAKVNGCLTEIPKGVTDVRPGDIFTYRGIPHIVIVSAQSKSNREDGYALAGLNQNPFYIFSLQTTGGGHSKEDFIKKMNGSYKYEGNIADETYKLLAGCFMKS